MVHSNINELQEEHDKDSEDVAKQCSFRVDPRAQKKDARCRINKRHSRAVIIGIEFVARFDIYI